jgi:hypothetical protein
MPENTAYATSQSQIGLAIEETRGTAETPKFWVPVKGPKYKPELTVITDNTLQGSMVSNYNDVPGLRYDSHGWDSWPYLDSFPLFLRAELGSPDTMTAASTATTLSSSAVVGATTVDLTASVTANTYIVIGSSPTQETHLVTAVTGTATPYAATLAYPLLYPQASGATVTSLTSHQFSLLNNGGAGNQPPSVTITDYDGEEWRQLAAGQLDKLSIKGTATGLVDYTCSWFADASVTPSAPTASFSSAQALPGWTYTCTVGDTILNTIVDWSLDLSRAVKPIPALTGSQQYYMFFADAITATGKLTVVEQHGAPQLTQYINADQIPLDLTLYDVKSGYAMNLHSSRVEFTSGDLDRSKEWVEVAVDFEMLPSASDATAGGVSPILATVANGQTTTF